ncbi:polysaccharide pyruvyl transferase family protein [Nitratireductor sp. GISD-1A_MAKvit]|uniref:polysaccharide pyruvyl transferase family protein n=1 Tax=Nitratireductor sp. GISD-1A_MAKvit TaxID=3234198 RepID=UPI0034650002
MAFSVCEGVLSRPIRLYWWRAPQGNFGDDLSPIIVSHHARRPVVHAGIKTCDMIAVGSLLGDFTKRRWQRILRRPLRRTHVWGTGCFGDVSGLYRHMIVHCVRGPLTRDLLRVDAATPLGDPALLLSRMMEKPKKRYRWGIIPHIHHQQAPAIRELARLPGVHRINLASPDTLEIARTIASCDFILSTSLHGLIVADAFGVPNGWMHRVGEPLDDWKFRDYLASVGRDMSPVDPPLDLAALETSLTAAAPGTVSALADSLERSFPC